MSKKPQAKPALRTRNVDLLAGLISYIRNNADNAGMGCFYGPTGYGKSRAVSGCSGTHQTYYVEMRSIWTRKYLLEMILQQMTIEPARTAPAMLSQVGAQLRFSGRPLVIDEADFAVRKGMIELLRDIYEASQGIVILIGEENMPAHLEQVERVHGRMCEWVAAQPVSLEDAKLYAGAYCGGVAVGDCLLERIMEAARGSARYVCRNLERVAEFARLNSLDALDAKAYTGTLFTGQAPKRRPL